MFRFGANLEFFESLNILEIRLGGWVHIWPWWDPSIKKSKEELESILEVFGFVLERFSREFISLFYVSH